MLDHFNESVRAVADARAVLSELSTFLTQVETHVGMAAIIAPDAASSKQAYAVRRRSIDRQLSWRVTGNRREPAGPEGAMGFVDGQSGLGAWSPATHPARWLVRAMAAFVTGESRPMTRDDLMQAARDAARHAHAPYSRFGVGAALLLDDGRVVTGCNFENASYGLSLCAETVALARANCDGDLRRVVEVAVIGGMLGKDGALSGSDPGAAMRALSPDAERGRQSGQARH